MDIVETPRRNNKKPVYIFFLIFFGFYLLLSFFAAEAVNIFQDGHGIFMNDVEAFMVNTMTIVMGITLIVFAKRFFRVKNNYFIILVLLLLFLSNAYALFSFPNYYVLGNGLTYELDWLKRFRYAYAFLNTVIAVYSMIVIGPQCKLTERGWNFAYLFLSAVVLASIVYSYIVEVDAYKSLFDGASCWTGVSSFTQNKNTYGSLLLFGIMAELYLLFLDKKWWWHLPVVVFYSANEFLSFCKTSIVCMSLLFVVLMIYWFANNLIKGYRVQSTTILFLAFIALLCAFGYFVFHGEVFGDGFLSGVCRAIRDAIVSPEGSTLEAREVIWKAVINELKRDPSYLLFGFGETNFSFVIGFTSDMHDGKAFFFAHNTFLEVWGRGGLVRLGCYVIALLALLILIIVHLFKKKNNTAWLLLFFFGTFLLQSSVESEFLFGNDMKSTVLNFLIVMPAMSMRYEKRASELGKEAYGETEQAPKGGSFFQKAVSFLWTLSISGVVTSLVLYFGQYVDQRLFMILIGAFGLSTILFTVLRLLLFKPSDEFICSFIVLTIVMLALGVGGSVLSRWILASMGLAFYPYTVTCFTVSYFLILLSLLFSLESKQSDFAFLTFINRLENRFVKRMLCRAEK